MASISGSQSGGKMVRPRRTTSVRTRTPYERPAPSQSRSPNWLSRFVISPTRFIASGAGKIFSSVLDLESSPAASSSDTSSTSSSSADSSAEEISTFDDAHENTFESDVVLNKGPQPLASNSKSKHIIEQLLMQELFSREEGDRLIKIIRSRVVDSPANDDNGNKRPREISNMTLGSDSPDLCNTAVMEAKKWLQEKKSGLNSNSDLVHANHSLNLVTSPQALKDEGSPVDVAKSYMRARPPWASPSIDHTKSPILAGIQLFQEGTPHLFSSNSTSSSKLKRESSAIGSWSIQDEIRRIRSRATEEMLRTLPSSKIDWSAFSMEHKNNVNSSAIENIGASLREDIHKFTDLADTSVNLASGLGSRATPELKGKLDGFQPETVLSNRVDISSEQNQAAIKQTEGIQNDGREITTSGLRDESLDDMHRDDGLVKVNGINANESNHQLDPVEETREALNSRLQDGNYSVFKEKVGAEDALENGFPSSGHSFPAGQDIEQDAGTVNNEPNTVDSNRERVAQGVPDQETCKLSHESTEVPDVVVDDNVALKEDDGEATGSQDSSSVQFEVQQDSSQAGAESGLAATPNSIAKRKGTRNTRYNRRGRPRSRGVK